MNGMSFVAGATGVLLVAYVVLITVGIAGAVCSIIGLVRGVSSRNATAVALRWDWLRVRRFRCFCFPHCALDCGSCLRGDGVPVVDAAARA